VRNVGRDLLWPALLPRRIFSWQHRTGKSGVATAQ